MRYQLAFRASDKTLKVLAFGTALGGGFTDAGSFYHDGGGVDPVDANSKNHVLYHDIQQKMYALGELNMEKVKILFTNLTGITLNIADAAMSAGSDATEQATITYAPTTASNTDVNYSSSDPAKATVSATGLVTALASGTTVITATSKDGGFTSSATVTVT